MVDEEEMTVRERRKYVGKMVGRYSQANRLEQGRLLDEMELVTGLHRKSLIRLLGPGGLKQKRRQRGRGKRYGHEVDDAIRVIAESLDYICAQRLTPALLETARHLASHGELTLSPHLEELLGQISPSTVERILSRLGQDAPRLPRKGPQEANRLAKGIPMERISWWESEPGHFEVDLVHHGGESGDGEYVHTLQMIDVATGWSERAAVLGRGGGAMEAGFERIRERLPFAIREIHPDNGSEFLNHHLVRYFRESVAGLRLSRSRPYQKNDNRFVEQKNDTLVRAYTGRARLDSEEEARGLDELYERMWIYYNLFQPVMRLKGKRIEDGKLKREWDRARTPFERLCETDALREQDRQRLIDLKQNTNPRRLRREIYELRDHLLSRRFREQKQEPQTAA